MSRDGILPEITQLPESTEELYLVALDDAKNGGANFNLDNMPSPSSATVSADDSDTLDQLSTFFIGYKPQYDINGQWAGDGTFHVVEKDENAFRENLLNTLV